MRASQGPTWDEGTNPIQLALAAALLGMLCIAWLARPAQRRPVLARACVAQVVETEEGVRGTVELLHGGLALLRVGDGIGPMGGVWVERDRLSAPDAAASPVAIVAAPDEPPPTGRPPPQEPPPAPAPHHPPPGRSRLPGRLERLGSGIFHARYTVAFGWAIVLVACMPLAITVEHSLSSGGFVPDGEAMRVEQQLVERFGAAAIDVVVVVPGDAAAVQRRLKAAEVELARVPHVQGATLPMVSADRDTTVFAIGLDSTEDDAMRPAVDQIERVLARSGLEQARLTGRPVFARDLQGQVTRDLARAELIGLPAALLVLLLVFRTVPAASLPLLVGTVSVWVTLAMVHVVALAFPVSMFVMNIASMLGFGLGIDYSLLGVSRFRDELARGRSVHDATVATVAHGGRAAIVSGIAVLLGMSGLVLVPLNVLQSIAIGGVIVVATTVFAAVTLLPAALAILGHRIEAAAIRQRPADDLEHGSTRWRAIAEAVMRHPALVLCVTVAALAALAAPALHAQLEIPSLDALPPSVESRVAERMIEREFGHAPAAPVHVVLDSTDATDQVAMLGALRGVRNVREVRMRGVQDGATLYALVLDGNRHGGAGARATVARIRALDGPARFDVGGQFAWELEFFEVMRDGMPYALGFVLVSTFLVLLVAFRSVVLPVKAILLDGLSVLATLGVLVLIFQIGFGAELLGVEKLGWVEASLPVVLFCVLFGLSMDYEVFLLARIAESWQDGADNSDATVEGIARTAPMVTGAALILIVIGLAFATTELPMVKQMGFGIAVALALDATVVRGLLVPAAMRLLGNWNWWVPDALARRLPVARWT